MLQNDKHIWYPFTQMKTAAAPIHITSAKDCTLFANDGRKYIDAISSWWVNIHGHANEKIADAISNQAKILEHVIFAGFTHTPAINLSNKLINILPNHFSKIFFSDDGSTSVEVAIKMALQFWHNNKEKNKIKIIAFENAYHGDTFGAMSVGARNEFNAAFNNHLFEVIHIPVPNNDNIEKIEKQFEQLLLQNNVAAFIFEPLVQGAAGMQMHSPKHLDILISIANKNKCICIADEVMTGFGRTGKNFAIEHLQHQPDIICLSKGITGGFMALGITACSQKIFDAFYADDHSKTFYHGHSYTANPLACSAANASIDILITDKCKNNIAAICTQHQIFATSISNHTLVKEIRVQGTILAIELKTDDESSYFNSIRDIVYQYFLEHEVLLRPLGNTIYIMPPYCITVIELNKIYTTIAQALDHFLVA